MAKARIGGGEEGRGIEREIANSRSTSGVDGIDAVKVVGVAIVDVERVRCFT